MTDALFRKDIREDASPIAALLRAPRVSRLIRAGAGRAMRPRFFFAMTSDAQEELGQHPARRLGADCRSNPAFMLRDETPASIITHAIPTARLCRAIIAPRG
jgi:hypothetical protein